MQQDKHMHAREDIARKDIFPGWRSGRAFALVCGTGIRLFCILSNRWSTVVVGGVFPVAQRATAYDVYLM